MAAIRAGTEATQVVSATTGQALAFPINNVAGNCLVAIIGDRVTVPADQVIDSKGNRWRRVVKSRPGVSCEIWIASNCRGGGNTVTVWWPANHSGELTIFEVEGLDREDPVVAFNAFYSASNVNLLPEQVFYDEPGLLIWGIMAATTITEPGEASGWSALLDGDRTMNQYKVIGSGDVPGSVDPFVVHGTALQYGSAICFLRDERPGAMTVEEFEAAIQPTYDLVEEVGLRLTELGDYIHQAAMALADQVEAAESRPGFPGDIL